MPEPWYGHLERAPILFLSSNPSIGNPPSVFTTPLPPHSMRGHPLQSRLGRAPTMSWENDGLERWYEDAFDFRVLDGKWGLEADGTPKDATRYWSSIKKRAEELIPDRPVQPGIDYALTEAVHCKSREEDGVADALKYCSKRYLLRVLEASAATVIMVMGEHAASAVTSCFEMRPEPHLEGPIRLGDRDRHFAFLPHPNARKRRSLAACFSLDEIETLRKSVATAPSASMGRRPTDTVPANTAEAGQLAASSTPIENVQSNSDGTSPSPGLREVEGSKGILGSWGKLIIVLAVVSLGYWGYRNASHQERKLPVIHKSAPPPQPSQKCAQCGAMIKLGNNYCTACGAKAEISK